MSEGETVQLQDFVKRESDGHELFFSLVDDDHKGPVPGND